MPINRALNRPRTALGIDLGPWAAAVFISVMVLLMGYRLLALLIFAMLLAGAWFIVRKHPKMLQLWFLSWKQKSYYDPRKH